MGGRLIRGAAALLTLGVGATACASSPPRPTPATTSSAPRPTTSTSAPCVDGARTLEVDGVRVRQFCGPARVQVTIGESTLEFAGGACERHSEWFALNVGVEVVDPGPPAGAVKARFRSFTVLMGRHPLAAEGALPVAADGVYTTGVLTFTEPPDVYVLDDTTVTLVATRTAATFSGLAVIGQGPPEPVETRGLFTCDDEAVPLDAVPALEEAARRRE